MYEKVLRLACHFERRCAGSLRRQRGNNRMTEYTRQTASYVSGHPTGGSKYTPDDIRRVPNSKVTFLKMGAFLRSREWPKLTIFCFAEQEWLLHGPGWSGWPKGEIWCTRISFRCLQLTFSLLQGILCFQACWLTAFSTQVPTLYSKSAFEMKALLTGMRLEGDQVVIFLKNGFWWESLRFLVYGGLCHAPLVFNWLRLAARMFPKVLNILIQIIILSFWVQPDNVQDTIGHIAAKVILDQTCFAPVSQIILKQKLR